MRGKYLIEMIDGGIKEIRDKDFCEASGCPTCGYGGWHVRELTLEMKGFDLLIKMGDMYNWEMIDYDDLIRWFDRNTEDIKNMTQEEFCIFIKREFKNNDEFRCDEVKISKIEEI